MQASSPKITIIETGSTNTRGFEITVDDGENASIQSQAEPIRHFKLNATVASDFSKAVASAGPLHALTATHCMKSASFGSSLFITRGDDRSPDLSCPVQSDRVAADLKKRAEDIVQTAQKTAGLRTFRRFNE